MMEPDGELHIGPAELALPIDVLATDDVVVVSVHGDVDLGEAGELRAVLNDACSDRHPVVQVDLTGVHFIGSSGMGVLASAWHQLAGEGRHLEVFGASEGIRQAFSIAGLAHVFEPTGDQSSKASGGGHAQTRLRSP